ncbi:hypothetical protein LY78DRAFT_665954 [Colletotrichum sublineola]|nr:hypothetical protein LY78DRAFT_665954 [Colletotrichum sublineola]
MPHRISRRGHVRLCLSASHRARIMRPLRHSTQLAFDRKGENPATRSLRAQNPTSICVLRYSLCVSLWLRHPGHTFTFTSIHSYTHYTHTHTHTNIHTHTHTHTDMYSSSPRTESLAPSIQTPTRHTDIGGSPSFPSNLSPTYSLVSFITADQSVAANALIGPSQLPHGSIFSPCSLRQTPVFFFRRC